MATRTEAMTQEDRLEDLFAAARAAPPVPSEALMARVMAEALAEQPRPAGRVAPATRPRLLARMVWALGGSGVLAGMGTAAAAGLYIGFVQPSGLAGLHEAVLGVPLETVELVPSVGAFLDGN